jgi:hypothetical protein
LHTNRGRKDLEVHRVEKRTKEPMLYIHQPSLKTPNLKMQEVYSAKQAEAMNKASSEIPSGTKRKKRKPAESQQDLGIFGPVPIDLEVMEMKSEDVQEAVNVFQTKNLEQNEIETNKKGTPSFQRVKPFKEMNVHERLDYLMEFPKQLPPVLCIFETGNGPVSGFISSRPSKDLVEITLLDKTIQRMKVDDLRQVKMLGFRGK